VIPAITFSLGHFPANFLESASVIMEIFEKMPKAVIAAFEFSDNVIRRMVPERLVHVRHFAYVVHVKDEAMDLVRDFSLGFTFCRGFLCHELADLRELGENVGKEFFAHDLPMQK
jgi:hypothetical protein